MLRLPSLEVQQGAQEFSPMFYTIGWCKVSTHSYQFNTDSGLYKLLLKQEPNRQLGLRLAWSQDTGWGKEDDTWQRILVKPPLRSVSAKYKELSLKVIHELVQNPQRPVTQSYFHLWSLAFKEINTILNCFLIPSAQLAPLPIFEEAGLSIHNKELIAHFEMAARATMARF